MNELDVELRPMSLAEILDAGFQLVKNRALLLGGVSLLGQVPSIVLFGAFGWMMDPFAFQGDELPDIGAVFFVSIGLYMLSMLLLMPYVVATITAAVGDIYLGADVSFASASRKGLARTVPLIVTYIIYSLVNIAAFLVVGGLLAGLFVGAAAVFPGSAGLAVLTILGIFALIFGVLVVGAVLYFVSGVLSAVVVLERLSLFEAVGRTWSLAGAYLSKTTGIAVTVYLIVLIAPGGAQLLVGAIPIGGAIIWGVVQALCQAYLFATAVVLYFDIRCRMDSFDLEHLAQLVEGREPSALGMVRGPGPIGI